MKSVAASRPELGTVEPQNELSSDEQAFLLRLAMESVGVAGDAAVATALRALDAVRALLSLRGAMLAILPHSATTASLYAAGDYSPPVAHLPATDFEALAALGAGEPRWHNWDSLPSAVAAFLAEHSQDAVARPVQAEGRPTLELNLCLIPIATGYRVLVMLASESPAPPRHALLRELMTVLGRLLSTLRPSTERLQALRALVGGDTEVMFNNVIDSLNEGVSCCDNDGFVLYNNPSLERITGYRFEEIKGKRVYEFFFPPESPLQAQRAEEQHRRYEDRRKGIAEEYEAQISRKDGELRWLDIKASPLRDRFGSIVGSIGVITDITERKTLEAQLLWSQKMEAVGRLAGSVAHDFNNLLTVVSGYANMLLKRIPFEDRNRKAVEAILAASKAACTLTQQLLAVSRRQVLQPRVVDLNEVILSTTNLMRGLIGERIQLRTDLTESLPPVFADRGQLQQVIMNLAINARDAMPDGGTLVVKSYSLASALSETAYDTQIEPGEYVVLSIADSGRGMDEFVRSRLFEPFFTTKRDGTGLGLSTAYGIVKQHHGHISVLSEKGMGTTFTIYFPRSTEAVDAQPMPPDEELAVPGDERILLVEDEPSVRELVRDMLVSYGYTVFQAGHGLAALSLLEEKNGAVDLVLTDVAMPEMNGIELCDKLAEHFPQIKILTMSGCTHDSTIPENIRRRQIPFIPKPFSPDALLTAVRRALELSKDDQAVAV